MEEFPDGTLLVLEDYLTRRRFLQVAASVPLASSAASGLLSPVRADASAFDRSIVRQMARDAASKPFKAPDTKLPEQLKNLDYDHYRAIRYLPERALWRGEKLPFEAGPTRIPMACCDSTSQRAPTCRC